MNMHATTASPAVAITGLDKTYDTGFSALKNINLEIRPGEIFALLGPNGAGKTTLIGTICGMVRPTAGQILVGGYDVITQFRKTRAMIGLVPQELTGDRFETVWATVSFTRGLFGKPRNDAIIEKILRDLSLWDKRNDKLITLSGGMKRRVLIAKALSHEPSILFLDEPTAGVDVELRRDMWNVVRELREQGVTIILTTHYIEEAEEMADRIGVISRGEIILVEDKIELMSKLGKKDLAIQLQEPLKALPPSLEALGLKLSDGGEELRFSYDSQSDRTGIATLIAAISEEGYRIKDVSTHQSSLEDIFIGLLRERT
ncbi:ABC transporter ATP-binding protein [Pelagibacterium luteolum]|uniref:ABC-2 type transport system ATP-binding protein n=1 Tax=Pelagibacterium luteolum TaxID=440168 RepID=A0A1G7WEM8_9HYPH|nr:ABC transporter ATP-binding protein [Pelagibacterium luteolum]SDG70386.1 ABC-2 type transport system ATP-binding protein [Pelagibacterium luteolum]